MTRRRVLDVDHDVDSTYDRHTRSWVTMVVHHDGGQCGPAAYDGTRADRDASIRFARVDATECWLNHEPFTVIVTN